MQKTEIINQDNLITLTKFAREQRRFDVIVTDPPYNIGITYDPKYYLDKTETKIFRENLCKRLVLASSLLTNRGSMFVIIDHKNAPYVYTALEDVANLKWRNTIIWFESFGTNCTKKFNRTTRQILYFAKSENSYFNNNSEYIRISSDRLNKYLDSRANPDGKLLNDLWDIPRIAGTHSERVQGVPTQIPLEIVRRCVAATIPPRTNNYTPEILDIYCGSGTTGCIAKEFDANFTGIEISPEYTQIAIKRIGEYRNEKL